MYEEPISTRYSPAECFVTEDNDDNNSNISEEQDEEYFIFTGRGSVDDNLFR